jgi:DNA (cytosine-5)-methyltransferase 1
MDDGVIQEPENTITEYNSSYKFIDLFCGIGGFHQALNNINAECVFACDIDEKCRSFYEKNYGITPERDITKIDIAKIPEFDILCGGFPCFIAGTQTLTNRGYKNIEDVVLEDRLMTHTGNFQKIINLQRKIYSGDLYDLDIKYHSEIITTTEEHPFYVREKKRILDNPSKKYKTHFEEPVWKTAKELTKNDYFGMVINTNEVTPEFTFDKTEKIQIILDKPEYWFMMGYFVGDGWIEETTKENGTCMNKIRFSINDTVEPEVLEIIQKVLPITDKNCDSISGIKCKRFGCSDFMWFQIFKMFGKKYKDGKLIPEWVQDAPKEFVQEFINGYMKANGCFNSNNILQITNVSYGLAYGLQRLYLKLGHIFGITKTIRPKTTVIEGRIVNQRDTYCIRGILTRERNVSSFIEDGYVWYAPFEITKREATEIPVYNFEVENDNSYIVENTIVHNCQPFSKSGFQKGFDDTRGTLFFNICEIIEKHKPKYLIMENVRNLSTHDNGNTWNVISSKIDELGYYTYSTPVILNTLHFNIPQNRERVIIMCKRKDLGEMPVLPEIPKTPKLNLTNHIKDFIYECEVEENKKYKITGKTKDVELVWDNFIKLMIKNGIPIPKFPIWTDWWDNEFLETDAFYKKYTSWINKNREFYATNNEILSGWLIESRENKNWLGAVRKFEWQAGDLLETDGMNNVLWTARGSGIRVKRLDYIPTLVAMSMIPVYGPESRKLSPKELLRLQSFPDTLDYNEKNIYKQVGNAVNVKMIERCARFMVLGESLF